METIVNVRAFGLIHETRSLRRDILSYSPNRLPTRQHLFNATQYLFNTTAGPCHCRAGKGRELGLMKKALLRSASH